MGRSVLLWINLIIQITLAQCGTGGGGGILAKATLKNGAKSGELTFTQADKKPVVKIKGTLDLGFKAGEHGFHVHTASLTSNSAEGDNCTKTGTHWNPFGKNHGGPNDTERHIGDFGNIVFDAKGIAKVDVTAKRVTLFEGSERISGRAILIHEKKDDLGKGGKPDSKTTGDAGGMLTCANIIIIDRNYTETSNALSIQKLDTGKTILRLVFVSLVGLLMFF